MSTPSNLESNGESVSEESKRFKEKEVSIPKIEVKDYSLLPKRVIIDSDHDIKVNKSYGIMIFCSDTNKWLLVRRKHSPSSFIISVGLFRDAHLIQLIPHLTFDEVKQLMLINTRSDKTNENNNSRWSFGGDKYLKELLSKYKDYRDKSELLIPRGKCQNEETPEQGAKREIREETGVDIDKEEKLLDLLPISDSFKIPNGNVYEAKFFGYIFKKQPIMRKIEDINEIEVAIWVSTKFLETNIKSKGIKESINIIKEQSEKLVEKEEDYINFDI